MPNTQINNYWLNEFAELTKYSQNKLYKILGPLLIGVELIKLPRVEHYRPHFVIYSLLGNEGESDLKSCLSYPVMLQQFFDRKKLQLSIPIKQGSVEVPDVIKQVKKSLPIPLDGDVALQTVINKIMEYSNNSTLGLSPNSYLQARLYKSLLKIVICCGEANEYKSILSTINAKPWKEENFKLWSKNVNSWKESVNSLPNQRNSLLEVLNINLSNSKLSKLNSSNIIN